MQIRSPPFWLMMVSIATAVLPVWRSPMISSRWPRPIGTRLSTAFSPVCMGSLTDLRGMMLGALDRALAVERVAQAVDHAAQQARTDWHVDDGARALDHVAFADRPVVAE